MTPRNLRTNGRQNPENLGDILPRFSWEFPSQAKCRLLVGESPHTLGNVWDSGTLQRLENWLDYGPVGSRKLRLFTRYFWRVCCNGEWSDPAEFFSRPPLPPIWAFGLWISRFSYETQEIILEIAEEFRRRRIPCDVIHPDLAWESDFGDDKIADENRLGDLRWRSETFPNPKALCRKLHDLGFKLCLIDHHQLRPDAKHTKAALRLGLTTKDSAGSPHWQECWSGGGHILDFTQATARQFFLDKMLRPLYEDGVDALKVDNAWYKLADGGIPDSGEPPVALHHLLARCHYEAVRKFKKQRGIVFSHDYNAHRMYPCWWTGDIRSTWESFASQVPMIMRNALAQQPLTSCDVGGFLGDPSPELYCRWYCWSQFAPIVRPHGCRKDREPWRFGPEVEKICRDYTKLRYRLLPYLYTEAARFHFEGRPSIFQPMEVVFPDDPSIRENWRPYTHRPDVGNDPSLPTPSDSAEIDLAADRIFHQHMVGDWLLVAPVVEEGATSRSVILPAGCKWYNWHTGEVFSGGQIIGADAPLEIVPLFVRAGAIIPLGPERYYIDPAVPNNPLTLRVFPGPPSEYVLYEDDGISEEYLDGSFARTTLAQRTVRQDAGTPAGELRTEIYISAREGNYSGAPSERLWELELHGTSAKLSWHVEGADLLSAAPHRLSLRARADASWHCHFNFLG